MNSSPNRNDDDVVVTSQEVDHNEDANDAVVKNLNLVQRFVSAIFADPSLLGEFSDEVTVVLIPTDDPELAETNLRGGAAMREAGQTVRFVYV